MSVEKHIDQILTEKLAARVDNGNHRELKIVDGLIDFSSNDYLGLNSVIDFTPEKVNTQNSGSRLLTGNSNVHVETENKLAEFFNADSALVFNSGYMANIGFFGAIPSKTDTVLFDRLCHASIRQGLSLCKAKSLGFLHNDLEDLEKKLKKASGNVFVVTESIFSMDGDEVPLLALCELAKKYNANVIVDEAHSTGIRGDGKGLVVELGLEKEVYARLHTFGKAFGAHGACWVGSKVMKDFLVNFSWPFIYTTAIDAGVLHWINAIIENIEILKSQNDKLKENIALFKSSFPKDKFKSIDVNGPIQVVIIPGNSSVKRIAKYVQISGFDVRPIMSPTVPAGEERLRISIHAQNTKEEIENLLKTLAEYEG